MVQLICEGKCSGEAIRRADSVIRRGQDYAKLHVDEIDAAYADASYTPHSRTGRTNIMSCNECGTERRWGSTEGWR